MIFKCDKQTKNLRKKTEVEVEPWHSLVLPLNYDRNPNFNFIKNNLLNSGLFNTIDYQELPVNKHQQTFIVDNITCLIDASDRPNINKIISSGMIGNAKFIFVLQYCLTMREYYSFLSRKLNINILPFVYGSSGLFPLSQFRWRQQDHKYLANFSFGTSGRHHRNIWIEKAKKNKKFTLDYTTGQEYVDCLKKCKWGLSLKGYGRKHDGKCYRETEFLSFGMPLAIAYKPYYAFPFIENVHYLYLENVNMLDALKTIDPRPFAIQSKIIWEKYYSPIGLTNLLFSIIHSEKYRNSILGFYPKKTKPKVNIKLDKIKCKK